MKSKEEKKLVKMKKESYIAKFAIFTGVVFVIFGIFSFSRINKNKQIEYPSSGLSKSVFALQNNEYESIKTFTNTYYLFRGQYAYDTPDVNLAQVGKSTFYQVSKAVTVGVTSIEGDENANLIDILGSDVKKSFQISSLESIKNEQGNRNGWKCTYHILRGFIDGAKDNGLAYVSKVNEGYFIVSAFSDEQNEKFEDLSKKCLEIYDTMRIPDEWIRNNETETEQLFVSPTSESIENTENN